MPEFLKLSSPPEAVLTLLASLPRRKTRSVVMRTEHALDRVVAEEVRSTQPLPAFQRSSVDGYALRARETYGVSPSLPGYLDVAGEIQMGTAPSFHLTPGTCALIHTGGMLPGDADAVIMLEYTQRVEKNIRSAGSSQGAWQGGVEILQAVAEGENVLKIGEDVAVSQVVLSAGTRIRPMEIGGCMALGIDTLRVVRKPRVGIISTGNEVIPPWKSPRPGQVRDVNSYSLAALVAQAGGQPVQYGIVPDDLHRLMVVARKALEQCEAVLITAGSSASAHDKTAEAIAQLGKPGVLVHGINIRPGKPTILAVCGGKAVIGLPGNPVSALIIARLFVVPVIEFLLGVPARLKPSVRAAMAVNVASQAGREDWVAVRLISQESLRPGQLGNSILAQPVFGKSNLIFTLAAAEGLVRIPADATGLSAGEEIDVYPL